MAARSSWKGYLRLSLVSVPVKAYPVTSSGNEIRLNQLHSVCHNRIRYQKVCPVHGEVPPEEIVRGYEYSKGHYVVLEPEELERATPDGERAVEIDTFIPNEQLDPAYQSGKTYYLLPDGAMGQKPYQLLHQALLDSDLQGVARAVLHQRDRVVLVRPVDRLLAMSVLYQKAEVTPPSALEDELVETATSKDELRLTNQLIQSLRRDDWDLGEYRSRYHERLTELIEAKVAGREVVTPPPSEEPQVINLMDALKASLDQIPVPEKSAAAKRSPAKGERRKAASKTRRAASETAKPERRRRRSG